jgi:hypothetical protein
MFVHGSKAYSEVQLQIHSLFNLVKDEVRDQLYAPATSSTRKASLALTAQETVQVM